MAKAGDIFLCKPLDVHWVVNESDEPFRLLVFKYDGLRATSCGLISRLINKLINFKFTKGHLNS